MKPELFAPPLEERGSVTRPEYKFALHPVTLARRTAVRIEQERHARRVNELLAELAAFAEDDAPEAEAEPVEEPAFTVSDHGGSTPPPPALTEQEKLERVQAIMREIEAIKTDHLYPAYLKACLAYVRRVEDEAKVATGENAVEVLPEPLAVEIARAVEKQLALSAQERAAFELPSTTGPAAGGGEANTTAASASA